jgi:hypothetical protein
MRSNDVRMGGGDRGRTWNLSEPIITRIGMCTDVCSHGERRSVCGTSICGMVSEDEAMTAGGF